MTTWQLDVLVDGWPTPPLVDDDVPVRMVALAPVARPGDFARVAPGEHFDAPGARVAGYAALGLACPAERPAWWAPGVPHCPPDLERLLTGLADDTAGDELVDEHQHQRAG